MYVYRATFRLDQHGLHMDGETHCMKISDGTYRRWSRRLKDLTSDSWSLSWTADRAMTMTAREDMWRYGFIGESLMIGGREGDGRWSVSSLDKCVGKNYLWRLGDWNESAYRHNSKPVVRAGQMDSKSRSLVKSL